MAPMEPTRLTNLLRDARQGCSVALGQLLNEHRGYLLVVANDQLGSGLQSKMGASDLVQQSFMEAQQNFVAFRGETAKELLGWLRVILRNNLANSVRTFQGTEKRQLDREVSLDRSSHEHLRRSLTAGEMSPSEQVVMKERLDWLKNAVAALPSPYREVVVWRNLELQPFAVIAQTLNRSEKAVQKLWSRAIRALQASIQPPS